MDAQSIFLRAGGVDVEDAGEVDTGLGGEVLGVDAADEEGGAQRKLS